MEKIDDIKEIEESLIEVVNCLNDQKISFEEFQDYYSWFVELVNDERISFTILEKFAKSLEKSIVVKLTISQETKCSKCKEKLSAFLYLIEDQDELEKIGVNRKNVLEICEDISNLGFHNLNKSNKR